MNLFESLVWQHEVLFWEQLVSTVIAAGMLGTVRGNVIPRWRGFRLFYSVPVNFLCVAFMFWGVHAAGWEWSWQWIVLVGFQILSCILSIYEATRNRTTDLGEATPGVLLFTALLITAGYIWLLFAGSPL